MCGIIGRVNFSGKKINPKNLRKATQGLFHRGPDDYGIWEQNFCGLGHRRLSIIDLSKSGNQPMVSSDNRYVCVFNGEIYNFRSLKQELSKAGKIWNSLSDTEVLLEGWIKWKEELLTKIDGMFAFVIWDKKEETIFAARDRIGEKPFYYNFDGNEFGFSSRPKQLFDLFPSLSKEYDPQSLRYYLESGYIPGSFSIFKKIKKLEPGTYMKVNKSGLTIKKYWNLSIIEKNTKLKYYPENKLVDQLDDILLRSVKNRMNSDVKLGAFLSGGIDSSLIVAMMKKNNSEPINTFTIGFNVKEYDESKDAESVAKFLGTNHYCKHIDEQDLLNLLPTFLDNFDEPFFDSAAFPTMAVSQLAKKHVSVVMTGDGGDELFGGYHYYKIIDMLGKFQSLPVSIKEAISYFTKSIPSHKFKLLGSAFKEQNIPRAFAYSRSIAKDYHNILSDQYLETTIGMKDLFDNSAALFPKNLSSSEIGMRLDTLFTLNDDYLQKTDMATMSYSLEARAPFLSQELVEWAAALPDNWKIKGSVSKYLLKQLAYRYIPKKILDRPKRGFGVPIDSWLRYQLYDWAYERIYNKDYYKGLPINQSEVIKLYQSHKSGKRNIQPLLWAILMLLEFNFRINNR